MNGTVIPSVVETIPSSPPTSVRTKSHIDLELAPEYVSTLPTNIKSLATKQFDELVRIGEIRYSPSIPEIVEDGGFRVQFRIAGMALTDKPTNPPTPRTTPATSLPTSTYPTPTHSPIITTTTTATTTSSTPSTPANLQQKPPAPSGPFINPDPRFVVTKLGENNSHTVLLNKFPILRPQLVIHTTEFQPQSEPLNESDVRVGVEVLRAFNRRAEDGAEGEGDGDDGDGYMLFFNCGVGSGASQAHKHMQVVPRPHGGEKPGGFSLFPDLGGLNIDTPTTLPTIPFTHYILPLHPETSTPEFIYTQYLRLLSLILPAYPDHNVIVVPEWIMVIPRRFPILDGAAANAVGMVGMIWVKDEEERRVWVEGGVRRRLGYLGVPIGGEEKEGDAVQGQVPVVVN
ncbi:hypothetical protein DFH27DRAFT_656848 [Peziza echinospora]|nr:hypothetical protein DFH27DRAFT_656848 [Peziza echinospora]